MAQSVYTTLETLQVETSVPEVKDKNGKVLRENMGSVQHTLPRENYPTVEIFDDEEQFLEWAQEHGALLSLLQAGINDWLTSDRATFKRMPRKDSGKNWSIEFGQNNVDNREWTIAKRPNAKNAEKVAEKVEAENYMKCFKMVVEMTGKGLDAKMIKELCVTTYGTELVEKVYEEMKTE